MPDVKPKYTPSITLLDLNNRRELLNEGVKGRNQICLYHKYPHLAPPICQIPPESVVIPISNMLISNDFSALYDDPKDVLTPIDHNLLKELISEFLQGPTITLSVAKKVHAYLIHVCEGDRHFRRQLLGGVPRSDALKFAGTLCAKISELLTPEIKGEKVVRRPVHRAVQLALEKMTYRLLSFRNILLYRPCLACAVKRGKRTSSDHALYN
jgi:hypothetical protein